VTASQLHSLCVAFWSKGSTRERRSRLYRRRRKQRIRDMTEPYAHRKWFGLGNIYDNFVEIDDVPRPAKNLIQWAIAFERFDRHVAHDDLGGAWVSSVFLGLDHGFGAPGGPVLYETMVFGGAHDGHQRRYHTRAEAAAGHLETLQMVQASLAVAS
jgi:hypothetical protein